MRAKTTTRGVVSWSAAHRNPENAAKTVGRGCGSQAYSHLASTGRDRAFAGEYRDDRANREQRCRAQRDARDHTDRSVDEKERRNGNDRSYRKDNERRGCRCPCRASEIVRVDSKLLPRK